MPSRHTNELTVAVAGCSEIGKAHLARWSFASGVRIAAVCDTNGVLVAQAAHAASCPGFTSITDMLQGDDPIDLLDVCLPLSERYEAVAAGLRAGANILCPAPFAPTVEQSIALTALAAERERILMPAMPLRYHPSVLFLHELIENDDLGRLEMFRCRLGEGSPEPGTDIRVGVALRGIDLFRFLCGEAATLSGRLARAHAESEGPDRAALLLQGEAGAIGVVEATQNAVGTQNVLELYGSAGAFLADLDLFTCRFLTADQPLWQGRSEGGPEAIERMLGHFADTVRGLQSPLTTAEDGWKGFALLSGVA